MTGSSRENSASGRRPAIPTGEAMNLASLAAYAPGAIVSRTIADSPAGTVTLFAFDAGQGLSEHQAPFDAMVNVLEGQADLTIGGKPVSAKAGDLVVMPANVPHALRAATPFKMLLIMIKA